MKRHLTFLLFATCCWGAWSNTAFAQRPSERESSRSSDSRRGPPVTTEDNLVYGKVGDRELKLDMARPATGDGPFPAILFIHGGGWSGGNRERWKTEIVDAAQRGFVAVTVSYRLTEPDKSGKATNPFPAAVNDVKCAARWLRANAAKYQVNPNKFGAAGDSAGGHLSLMLGLTDASAKLEGDGGSPDQSSRVQAVVNIFGPTDMRELHRTCPDAAPIVAKFLNGTPDEAAENYRASSPITYASKTSAAVLTIHGTDDKLVPPGQAELLDRKLKEVGGSHTLLLIEGEGHGFLKRESRVKQRDEMYAFFIRQLKS